MDAASILLNTFMWLCDKEKVKLYKFTYLPDPRDGFMNVQIRVIFSDGVMSDSKTWTNDAMSTAKSVKALAVLTAYMVDNEFGFSPLISVNNQDADDRKIKLYYKKTPYDNTDMIELHEYNLPGSISDALEIICNELEAGYGVDYLDV